VAPPVTVQNGQPDAFFVAEVRRIFRDQPTWQQESPASDGSSGAIATAGSKTIHLNRPPVQRSVPVYLTALFAAGQVGATSYLPLLDPPPPTFNPVVPPVTSDGGGGGTFSTGNHQTVYTYVIGGAEYGLSPLSNITNLASSHQLTVAALTNLPSAVTAVNDYLVVGATGEVVGRLGQRVVTTGTAPTTTYTNPPSGASAGMVPMLVVSDTGELQFPLAPPTGTVAVRYQTARFSDQQVIDGLYEGLDMLWPEIWTPAPVDTTSVLPSPIQWEYALPVATYGDPRTVIMEVETQPPSAFVIFTRLSNWRFLNDSATPTLIFAKPPPVGGTVRITYTTPYTTLAQVPQMAAMLPVYYAVARLMSDQEVMRSRADDLPALTAENAGSEKGGSMQTAAWWLQNMFGPALTKMSLGYPARHSIMSRVAEKLNLSPLWTGMQ
jgi:hypothetical protein